MIFKHLIPDYYIEDHKKPKNNITWILTFLFFILSLIGILNHELWLDEAHHWLLGRDSTNFSNLLYNTKYEGHPLIWNILIFYISRITSNPFWMQFLHILISSTAILIFLKKAPFSFIIKLLFIFSYYIFFEYNLISRNYALGLLFIILAISVYKNRKEKLTLLCLYLAIAINTHLIFAVIAFGIYCTLFFENITTNKTRIKLLFSKGSVIVALAIIICAIQVIPPQDTYFFEESKYLSFYERMIIGFTSFFKGLFPVPDFRTIHFWNTNVVVNMSKIVAAILSLLTYMLPYILFRKNKISLFFSYITLLGANIYFYITQLSSTRQFGMTFVILIVALWIHSEWYKNNKYVQSTLSKYLIYSILFVQFLTGIYAYGMDIKYPFASSKKIVEILVEKDLTEVPVVTTFCEGTIFSPYLKEKVYFLCGDDYESFCDWNRHELCDFTNEAIIEKISELKMNKSIVFISNETIFNNIKKNDWNNIHKSYKVKPISSLDKSILKNTSYLYLYLIKFNNVK